VIAPGLESMTDYLYQRTALLPRINLREPVKAIGKSTEEAMMAGAVFGYRGLVRQILEETRRELRVGRRLQIVATGGYADLIADRLPEVQQVHPNLTLEGLRIIGNLNWKEI
jgi:type III pantothenate kinase